jgi:hypothetical protein
MRRPVPADLTPRVSRSRHLAVALAFLVGAAALGGCAPSRGHETPAEVRICGHTLAGGVAVPEIRRLTPPHDAPPAPRRSVLPAPYRGRRPGTAMLRVIRLSADCAHGVVALVTPSTGLRTTAEVHAPDGTLVALCLVRLTTTPARVYAYRNGRPIGELPL